MKTYQITETNNSEEEKALAKYPELLRKLLALRGVTDGEEAELFLNPNYARDVHDPFLIKDMDKAVRRVLTAIKNKEKIVIYSDYDHDGIPGGVILHDFFKKIKYENFSNYIPHRHLEGYGLHNKALDGFASDGANLLITVDLGSSDTEQVAYANKLGIDVIITDHHITPEVLPKAFAILNSKQPGDTYQDSMLAGSGVAFKLVQGILARGEFDIVAGWEKWLLDLVSIGTIADMVPLRNENRALAYYGLQVLRKSPRVGLVRLLSKMKIKQNGITEDDIGFMIAPRINAASRMGEPKLAFDMLATNDSMVSCTVVDSLETLNSERKGVVASVVKEIKHILEKRESLSSIIVLGNPLWSPSLLGLTANNIAETYGKSVFLWGRGGSGELKGSCRSDGSVDVVLLMSGIDKEVLLQYGGHKMAGGFSVSHEKIHLFESVLLEQHELIRGKSEESKIISLDAELFLDDVNWNTYSSIERLAPFGVGNPKPLFLFKGIKVFGLKQFGKEGNHLEVIFQSETGKKITAIGFFMNEASFGLFKIEVGKKINLVATLEKSTFRSFPELRLRIVDVI